MLDFVLNYIGQNLWVFRWVLIVHPFLFIYLFIYLFIFMLDCLHNVSCYDRDLMFCSSDETLANIIKTLDLTLGIYSGSLQDAYVRKYVY